MQTFYQGYISDGSVGCRTQVSNIWRIISPGAVGVWGIGLIWPEHWFKYVWERA